MLTIELDGAGHFTDIGQENDKERTNYLENLNIKVIRFENKEVFNQTEGVIEEIKNSFRK